MLRPKKKESTREAIQRQWGDEAVKLIMNLLEKK